MPENENAAAGTSIRRLAVIGATGMLGKPVTRALIDAGYEVTIIARAPAKAKPLYPGIHIVPGDVLDAASMHRALEGQEAVYVNLHTAPGEDPQGLHAETDGVRNIIVAAEQHGLRRIGYISSLVKDFEGQDGFSWWVFEVKQRAVDLLKATSVPTLIFYPSSFMENFENGFRRGDRLLLAGTSEHKMYFIAGRDYGKQVARAFALPGKASREFVVQGLDGYTAEEAARIYAEHHPGALSIVKAPMWTLHLAGLFGKRLRYGARIVEALNRYPETFEAQATWDELGKPTMTLAAYARAQT